MGVTHSTDLIKPPKRRFGTDHLLLTRSSAGARSSASQHFFFGAATYERVFNAAGLTLIQWHPLKLGKEGLLEYGPEYWNEYMNNPPVIGIECRR